MFENSNKIQKVILSISFIISLPVIFIGWIFLANSDWIGTLITLLILIITPSFFYKLWADKE